MLRRPFTQSSMFFAFLSLLMMMPVKAADPADERTPHSPHKQQGLREGAEASPLGIQASAAAASSSMPPAIDMQASAGAPTPWNAYAAQDAHEADRKAAYEAFHQKFRGSKLVYRPNRENPDEGKVELPIADLASPFMGTFNLSGCGDAGQYVRIGTGYRIHKAGDKIFEMWIGIQHTLKKEIDTPLVVSAMCQYLPVLYLEGPLRYSRHWEDASIMIYFNRGDWEMEEYDLSFQLSHASSKSPSFHKLYCDRNVRLNDNKRFYNGLSSETEGCIRQMMRNFSLEF